MMAKVANAPRQGLWPAPAALGLMLLACLLVAAATGAAAKTPGPPLPPIRPAIPAGAPPKPLAEPPAGPEKPSASPTSEPAGPPAPAKPADAKPADAKAGTAGDDGATCLGKLTAEGVKAESVAAPPAPLPDCRIDIPVRLSSVALATGATLDLPGRPLLGCAFAGVFADYARGLVAPLGASLLGSPVAAIATGPGYQCRGRNQVTGAKTSAHGKGIAVDVMEFVLADHRRIAVARPDGAAETLFLHAIRQAACGWFTTVLGPGSDAAHASHMHLDVEHHGASERYRICD